MTLWAGILGVSSALLGIAAYLIRRYTDPEILDKARKEKAKKIWDKTEKKLEKRQKERLSS